MGAFDTIRYTECAFKNQLRLSHHGTYRPTAVNTAVQ